MLKPMPLHCDTIINIKGFEYLKNHGTNTDGKFLKRVQNKCYALEK